MKVNEIFPKLSMGKWTFLIFCDSQFVLFGDFVFKKIQSIRQYENWMKITALRRFKKFYAMLVRFKYSEK